jgi:hypothetical protein
MIKFVRRNFLDIASDIKYQTEDYFSLMINSHIGYIRFTLSFATLKSMVESPDFGVEFDKDYGDLRVAFFWCCLYVTWC